jgi:uncharacterized protein (DUF2141 family)
MHREDTMMSRWLCLMWVLWPALALAQQAGQNTIRVAVEGLHSDKGQVLCELFSSADGFPKSGEKAVAQVKSTIASKHAQCEFAGIAPGTYAVALFHDENSNGKLDTNFLGIPREGTGASNDAKGRMGPPKFADAAFQFRGGLLDLKVTVVYP